MKHLYGEKITTATKIEDSTARLTFLTSILRSILQTAIVTSLELIKKRTPSDEIDLNEFVIRFGKPSDGLPIEIIDNILPFLRRYVEDQYMFGWYEKTPSHEIPLYKNLASWVEFRNSRQGHGVLDINTSNDWAERTKIIIEQSLQVFGKAIPDIDSECKLKVKVDLGGMIVDTPIIHKGEPIVILIASASKGIWKLKGQALSLDNAQDFTTLLPEENIFSLRCMRQHNAYDLVDFISNNKEYSVFHNIPTRQTDLFEGRKNELNALHEWMSDDDSRYCLVFGDGGYGKTTLVLEFLNQLLESQMDLDEPLPELISYHTAKMTKWTEDGLIHFKGLAPAMDECLRELVRCFYPTLTKDWYVVNGSVLIEKAVTVLRENQLNRNNVLLILDNTETLATTPQEVKDLGAFFQLVGKKIGRIIITSRRREFINATPISVEGLSENEGANLLKRLANEYNASAVKKAGEAKLRKVSNQLKQKPILLETLVKYISRSDCGIDAALDNLLKKSSEELLSFLYEDAWHRMNDLQKDVFLLLINLTSPLDQNSISQACQEVGIQHSEFHSGLMETHFAVLTDYGSRYSLELIELASRFFHQQFSKKNEIERNRIRRLAEAVDIYAQERDRIEKAYRRDRVAEAFRSEYAKAAKVSADKGNIETAIEMYKLAIQDDPLNSSLYDRFSWLLFNKTQDYELAKTMAEKAIEIDSKNSDALVSLALIHYRLNDLTNGDLFIERSHEHGRTISFVYLRKGIARYHSAKVKVDLNEQIKMIEDGYSYLQKAEKSISGKRGYDAKNIQEISKYQDLCRTKLKVLRASRTTAEKTSLSQ